MRRFHFLSGAFSLVEVTIALGVVAFALLAILALVPIGIKTNQISAEETRAICILSAMEADLRNTHPSANAGRSQIFGFLLPYALSPDSRCIFNTALSTTSLLGDGTTTGLNDAEVPTGLPARYQASVIYTKLPLADSAENIEARLVVNWPSVTGTARTSVTEGGKTSGFVETVVSFPAP